MSSSAVRKAPAAPAPPAITTAPLPTPAPVADRPSVVLDAKVPGGTLEKKWEKHKFDSKLINPANRRKYEIIVVGSGLAGASAAAPHGAGGRQCPRAQEDKARSMLAKIRRNVVAGILTAIPILVTVWVISFLVGLLVALGSPFVRAYVSWLRIHSPTLAEGFSAQWFQGTISVAIVLAALYVLGEIATAVAGRRLLAAFDYLMARIPIVQSIYGAARQLVSSFQTKPGSSQRVVLIEFPSPEMKTVGLVTRIFNDADTGEEIAAVYVPTTPNPTSGYMELVPTSRLVMLDWTINEAMTFIMSGGAAAPPKLNYSKSVGARVSEVRAKPNAATK